MCSGLLINTAERGDGNNLLNLLQVWADRETFIDGALVFPPVGPDSLIRRASHGESTPHGPRRGYWRGNWRKECWLLTLALCSLKAPKRKRYSAESPHLHTPYWGRWWLMGWCDSKHTQHKLVWDLLHHGGSPAIVCENCSLTFFFFFNGSGAAWFLIWQTRRNVP